MSEFLFLMAMGWIMRKTTTDKRRGIRWNLTTVLEDIDFADDIALLSSKFKALSEDREFNGGSSHCRQRRWRQWRYQEQTADSTRCIPEAMEGAGSQRNREENQDTPVQD